MGEIRIMIADDHAILRAGLRALLDAQDDMVVIAEAVDGNQAVDLAIEHNPDVLLLDLTMPGKGGIEAIRDIRKANTSIRILVLTMHDDVAYLRSVLEAGGSGYLVKRAADTELLAAIRVVHQGRSYIDVSLGDGDVLRAVIKKSEDTETRPLSILSDRERQVLSLVALGHTHKEIAQELEVSIKTVETYRGRLSEKLHLRSRAELVRYALDIGVLKG